jgi:MoCo/4Fe-4S cofactor protein with predicted Tat translocation signal
MQDMDDKTKPELDLAGIRRRLADSTGRAHWMSLEEVAGAPGFQAFVEREFPEQASEWDDPEGRRNFLKIMSASLALAGLSGCTRQPEEKIVPYVRVPENMVPGKPMFFATATLDRGYAKGVLAESHDGRPTKIEGNPEHPVSQGASDVHVQASVLDLYDPDRSQTVIHRSEISTWAAFLAAVRPAMEAQRGLGGAGLRILTGTVTSPTLAAQIEGLLQSFPGARWHQWDPAGFDNQRLGLAMAHGRAVSARADLAKADVIVAFEADFMGDDPANLRLIREFATRRAVSSAAGGPSPARLYVAEATPSMTGSNAEHRLPIASSRIEALAGAVAYHAGAGGAAAASLSPAETAWATAVAKDLKAHAGRSVVLAGHYQPPAVHVLAHQINQALGNVGTTVSYADPVEARPMDQLTSLRELAAEMNAGRVELLLILGSNPVYSAPPDLAFLGALEKVALRVHVGQHPDETAEHCHWHVPEAHHYETWGDARAADGTVTILQPLVAPLYQGRSLHEVVAAVQGGSDARAHDVVREAWRTAGVLGFDFEKGWRKALHDGVVPGTVPAFAPVLVRKAPASPAPGTAAPVAAPAPAPAATPSVAENLALAAQQRPRPPAAEGGPLEIVFRPDPSVLDGRYANNAWLQELPRPLTRHTWDNLILLSPATAEKYGIHTPTLKANTGHVTEVVELRFRGGSVRGPAWVSPGQADGVVAVHLGHGRRRAGRIGNGVGFDANVLRTSDAQWFGRGAEIVRTGETTAVACVQDHFRIESHDHLDPHKEAKRRNLVRALPLAEYRANPDAVRHMGHEPPKELTLYPAHEYKGHKWGMAIDLASCVGCNACVVACVAENNIPVVGKDQVARGREMHWLRVDRYFEGSADNPSVHHQPVPCMQCEDAPCEVVCPVAATVHSDEGLNDMVYNRCVGTKYCSNNCPYKVRRFNFLLYTDYTTPSYKLQRNPDVTVRSRGVMEKCTYCVQRIQAVRIQARNEDRPIKDGEIKTACQQACPAQAITFGDLNDPQSAVSKQKKDPRNYAILADLNTKPRTTYMAEIRNPSPDLGGGPAPGGGAQHG